MQLRLSILLAAFLLAGCQTGPSLRGQLATPTPAADFELTSQSGQRIRLADLQGRVVVLTFLDTDCSGDCPGITAKLAEASGQIDYSEAGRVAFLAVTAAPEKDSVEKAAQFSHQKGMPANFYFLTGPRSAVEPVWASYSRPGSPNVSPAQPERLVLIDPGGKVRSYMAGPEFTPKDLRHNIRVLLAEENLLILPLCH